METILFARVSSREQEETGYSLSAQEKLLKEYASRRDFRVNKTFSIAESASGQKQRKIFKEMLDYIIKNDVKVIVCEKVDRLTRNLKDAVCINEWINEDFKREVHFVKENCILNKGSKSNEKFIWNIKVSVAQYYIDNLSEETKKGLLEKAEEKWYPGNHKRGYKTIGDIGHKIWAIDDSPDSEVPFIKKIFELYAKTNWSLKKLNEEIFKDGWKQKNGKPYPKSTLAFILNDIFYCGRFKWQGKIYQGNHEPLVSEEIFEIVQQKLHRKGIPKYRTHNHLFKGMMECEECHCAVTAEIQKGHTYYHCTHYKNCSQRKYVREEEIEKQILGCFDEIAIKDNETLKLITESLRESHTEEMSYHNQALTILNKRYQTIQNRLDSVYIDKLDGRIALEKYEELEAQFRKEQEETRQELARHENANINYFELGANLVELSSRAKEIYLKRESIEDKRRLLSLIFLNLTLKDGFVRKTYQKPFQIISERVKNGNWLPGLDSNQDRQLQRLLSYR